MDSKPEDKPPLSEKDFIKNGWSLKSYPFWLWIFLMAALTMVFWGTSGWYEGLLKKEKGKDPFLEVTNREFSVFLWQFPAFIRNNVSKKTGYLPGFSLTSENLNLATAEEWVSAPPELIFLYHTWSRLLAKDFIARPINSQEFSMFLEQLPEWQPDNWKKAPKSYQELVDSNKYLTMDNLQTLSESELPLIVRQAFLGWKNYYMEGPNINEVRPTINLVQLFLGKHPTYARSYWRNIDKIRDVPVAGKNYLLALLQGASPDSVIPNDQLSSFLKVAYFNEEQAQKVP